MIHHPLWVPRRFWLTTIGGERDILESVLLDRFKQGHFIPAHHWRYATAAEENLAFFGREEDARGLAQAIQGRFPLLQEPVPATWQDLERIAALTEQTEEEMLYALSFLSELATLVGCDPHYLGSDTRTHHYTVHLTFQGRRFIGPFFWKRNEVPTAYWVLKAALQESQDVEDYTLQGWATEYGYDLVEEEETTQRRYAQCREQAHKLRTFLGEYYDAFQHAEVC